MKNYITYPHVAGVASRQAHADLPAGTFEREMSKDGFFGPAAHLYHRHPPTGWVEFEGPLRPHAFDLAALPAQDKPAPLEAAEVVGNGALQVRFWKSAAGDMDHLVRNGDGDELLFIHAGRGELYCDFGHLSFVAGDYILLPRGTLWRVSAAEPLAALLIEATQSSFGLPEKGLVGAHALFDPAMLDVPQLDDAFRAQQSDTGRWQVRVRSNRIPAR